MPFSDSMNLCVCARADADVTQLRQLELSKQRKCRRRWRCVVLFSEFVWRKMFRSPITRRRMLISDYNAQRSAPNSNTERFKSCVNQAKRWQIRCRCESLKYLPNSKIHCTRCMWQFVISPSSQYSNAKFMIFFFHLVSFKKYCHFYLFEAYEIWAYDKQ